MTKSKDHHEIRELEETYNIDIDDLTPLLEYTLWLQKNLPQSKKDAQKRIRFLRKTLKEWEIVEKDTDVKEVFYRDNTWRFNRLLFYPPECANQIVALIEVHKTFLEDSKFREAVSPLNALIFILAHLFKHSDRTTVPIHYKHVDWSAVNRLLEYWRSKMEVSADVIPYTSADAIRKRYEETRQRIRNEYGRIGEWRLYLNQTVLSYIKDRKSLDRAGNRAWKRLSSTLSQKPAKE